MRLSPPHTPCLCRYRGRFCLCEGTTKQESPGGKEQQIIIAQVRRSWVQLAQPNKPEEQVVNKQKRCNQAHTDRDGSNAVFNPSLNVSDRVPLDERLHERDLEAAIVLSLLNREAGQQGQSCQGGY